MRVFTLPHALTHMHLLTPLCTDTCVHLHRHTPTHIDTCSCIHRSTCTTYTQTHVHTQYPHRNAQSWSERGIPLSSCKETCPLCRTHGLLGLQECKGPSPGWHRTVLWSLACIAAPMRQLHCTDSQASTDLAVAMLIQVYLHMLQSHIPNGTS